MFLEKVSKDQYEMSTKDQYEQHVFVKEVSKDQHEQLVTQLVLRNMERNLPAYLVVKTVLGDRCVFSTVSHHTL